MRRKLIITWLSLSACIATAGQSVGVKTNLASDAVADVNFGVEVGLASKWTFEVVGDYMGWDLPSDMRRRHVLVQPELRWWVCDRWIGHHFGIHGIGSKFNFGMIGGGKDILGTDFGALEDHRYQGYSAGAGIAYGYDWVLSRHWNLEAEAGIGFVRSWYDEYQCEGCGRKTAEDIVHDYWGVTKAALTLIYLF